MTEEIISRANLHETYVAVLGLKLATLELQITICCATGPSSFFQNFIYAEKHNYIVEKKEIFDFFYEFRLISFFNKIRTASEPCSLKVQRVVQ